MCWRGWRGRGGETRKSESLFFEDGGFEQWPAGHMGLSRRGIRRERVGGVLRRGDDVTSGYGQGPASAAGKVTRGGQVQWAYWHAPHGGEGGGRKRPVEGARARSAPPVPVRRAEDQLV